LALANTALGAGSTPYSISDLDQIAFNLNSSFNAGSGRSMATRLQAPVRITVGKSASHHRSRNEIGNDNPGGLKGSMQHWLAVYPPEF